jgi:hypothetical protein
VFGRWFVRASAALSGILTEDFSLFYSGLPDKCPDVTSIRPWPFPSNSFPIHHSFFSDLTILPAAKKNNRKKQVTVAGALEHVREHSLPVLRSITGGTDEMHWEPQGGMFGRWLPILRNIIVSPCRPVFFRNVLSHLDCAVHNAGDQSVDHNMCDGLYHGSSDLFVNLPPQRLGFSPRRVHVGFMVDGVTVGQVFCSYFGLGSHVSVILWLLHAPLIRASTTDAI